MQSPQAVMDGNLWASSDWKKRIFVLRVPELVVLFVLGMIALSYSGSDPNSFAIPAVVSVSGNRSSDAASFNPLFAYPIELDGHSCVPEELSLCIADASASQQQRACCESLQDKDSYPSETIPNKMNYGLIFGVTITVLTLRALLWRHVSKTASRTISDLFWALLWWDSGVALLLTCAYTGVTTTVLKYGIGYPRPNYYALTLFASVHESDRENWHDAATLSTPSGHAAMSMCAFSFVSLLLLSDAYYVARLRLFDHTPIYKCLGYIALGLMLLPLYIGVSRVFDYFHFAADVIAGWLLGLFFSGFSFAFHCDLNNFLININDKKTDNNSLVDQDEEGNRHELSGPISVIS